MASPEVVSAHNAGLMKAAAICEETARKCTIRMSGLCRSQRAHYRAQAKLCLELSNSIKFHLEPIPVTVNYVKPPKRKWWWKFWKWSWWRDIRESAVEDDLPEITEGMLKRAKLQNWDNHD